METQGKKDAKKLAAAMAAVFAHIKTHEEAAALHAQQAPFQEAEKVSHPVPAVNVWGMAGRQEIMQANTMMQLRAFK